ncbi:MAG: hypothetical protein RBT59_02045 [Arcobacteraceae bacterium]|jgi:hypothetical protein|nr:hypothetical protein [Arcobacteraceae bacterium]
MSLKENVSYIKDEISTEEQFFENFFKIEKFYKKYKKIILAVVVAGVLGLIGMTLFDFLGQKNAVVANEAYTKVLLNNNDKGALDELKSANEELYNIALFQISQEKTTASNVAYLKDIASYNTAVAKGDIVALDGMIMQQDFLLKDFAVLSKTLILIEKKEYKKAKDTIARIDEKSRVLPLSNMIKHFLLTK